MNTQYTILVNSTDSFEDCWEPFFKLFSTYWPECSQPIVLNTETKDFSWQGLNLKSSKVAEYSGRKNLTWSECLLNCLDQIETDIILYLQEDYFLHAPVDAARIQEYVNLMLKQNIATISLVSFSNSGPFQPTEHPELWRVGQKADYRISLQASLWKKDALKKYLRKHENPWQLEIWGTKRAHRIRDNFLCVNRDIFNRNAKQILPYKPTGIVKGKWKEDIVVDLFRNHNIHPDYSIRGFHNRSEVITHSAPIVKKVKSYILSYF